MGEETDDVMASADGPAPAGAVEAGEPPSFPVAPGQVGQLGQMEQGLPQLNVSGVVVTKADLVAALRPYLPLLVDITPLEGGRFVLSLTPGS